MIADVERTHLSLEQIRIDGGTQPRADLSDDVISEYAASMLEGVSFPPVAVFYDGSAHWLADGFHRYYAALRNGNSRIEADIRQGTLRDAVLYSVGTNATHGLRRTNADKRRAVEMLLRDAEWQKWSDREIARRCGVHHQLVGQLRPAFSLDESSSEERTYTTKHGTPATMKTANIGQAEFLTRKQFVNEVFPGFAQWQQDNVALGLDPFGDVLPEKHEAAPVLSSDPLQTGEPVKSASLIALQSSESNEWYTPAQYVEAARTLMGGIDVDPASCEFANRTIKATTYYTQANDGLGWTWGKRVWLNPPYGFDNGASNQEIWTAALIERYQSGEVAEAVLLCNANTEARWFQPLYGYLICLTNHRIRFYNHAGQSSQPTQGNALVYFGTQERRFVELFRAFGTIVRRVDRDE